MAWDSTRTVPWRRLVTEWLIYIGFMALIVVVFMRDRPIVGILGGLLVSGPLYVGLGAILAKFGHTRKSWGELRGERATRGPRTSTKQPAATPTGRAKPAPTKRTGASTRPTGPSKRR